MIKSLLIVIALFDGVFCSATVRLLQIIPGGEKEFSNNADAYLISAIIALVGTISFLFVYSKSLNKIIKSTAEQHAAQLQEVYKEQIRDYKEVTAKNTEAFLKVVDSNEENTASNKETAKTIHELRLWLIENLIQQKR